MKKQQLIGGLTPKRIGLCVLFAGILAIGTESYIQLLARQSLLSENLETLIRELAIALNYRHLLVFFGGFLVSGIVSFLYWEQIARLLYRFRWPIGFAIIALAVLFKINGSSIGVWNVVLQDPDITDNGVKLGIDRIIRSDEWSVSTPMSFSQYYTGFSLFGELLRGTTTDMYIVYGQPVWDWAILFRPFQIGYLFLDQARGLSFCWVGKWVVLLLVSFEMGMLLTKKKKGLALTYSMMVAFAPVVQWWFGTNFFPEMLIYGQGIILCIAGYMRTEQYVKRVLYSLGFVLCAGAYLMVMYPAWQISFFYVFLILGLWVLAEYRKAFHFTAKKDIPILIGSIALLILCMTLIIVRHFETIMATLQSAYPGNRTETGGDGISALFLAPGNLFFPFTTEHLEASQFSNQSALATFFDLFPLGIFLSGFVLWKDKIKDKLLFGLWGVQIFLGIYIVVGFPEILAKVTLLSQVQGYRAIIAFAFANVILLIRALAIRKSECKASLAGFVAVLFSVGLVYCSKRYVYGEYLSLQFIALSLLLFGALFFLALRKGRRMQRGFCILLCVTMLVMGGMVNPVRVGIDVVEQNRISQAIRQIEEQESGLWISATEASWDGNFILMNGAACLSSTNIYCNFELWEKLDPDGVYEEIYNRYAHITVVLTKEEPTSVGLVAPDNVLLSLHVDDLALLGVDYIFASGSLEELETEQCSFTLLEAWDDIDRRIYQVTVP